MRPARPAWRVATAIATTPPRNTSPPRPATHAAAGATPRTLTSSAPVAIIATAARRTRADAGCPAASAATKNGITPAMAVVAPPARARWSGSHAAAGRGPSGPASAAIAASARNPPASATDAIAIRRSSARRGPAARGAERPMRIRSEVTSQTYTKLVIVIPRPAAWEPVGARKGSSGPHREEEPCIAFVASPPEPHSSPSWPAVRTPPPVRPGPTPLPAGSRRRQRTRGWSRGQRTRG